MRLRSFSPALGLFLFFIPPMIARSHAAARAKRAEPDIIEKHYLNIPSQPRSKYSRICTDAVRATVTSLTPHFPDGGMAYTDVGIQVSWALKDVLTDISSVQLPGAQDADHLVVFDRTPRLVVGDDVVFFLRSIPDGHQTAVLGLDEGTYRVRLGDDGALRVSGVEADDTPVSEFEDELLAEWMTDDEDQH